MTTQPEALRIAQRLYEASTKCDHHYSLDRTAASELERLHAECEALRATPSDTLLRLLCDLRFALGDDGTRMQPELVEYARGMRADAERWRCFRTFVAGKSTRGFLNGKPAAYMVLPAITVERVGMTLDESIDAARAAKEQSNA